RDRHSIRIGAFASSTSLAIKSRDQAIDAVLRNLLGELVAVVLNQPDAFDIQIIDFPSLRRFLQAIVNTDAGSVARHYQRANDDVIGRGVAAEGLDSHVRTRVHFSERPAIGTDKR